MDNRSGAVPKTTIKNVVLEDIMNHSDFFMKNKTLMKSIY